MADPCPKALADKVAEARIYAEREGFSCSTICPTPEESRLIEAALRAAPGAEAMRERAAQLCERDMHSAIMQRDMAGESSPAYGRFDLASVALRDVAAAIRALTPDPGSAPAEGWREIETAPKVDPECPSRGPVIFLGGPGWASEAWWGGEDEPQWIVDLDVDGSPIYPHEPPTCWQPWPLPPPPQPPRQSLSDAQEGRT